MKINDKYALRKAGQGITLKEIVEIKDSKTGEIKPGEKEHFYGTAYQALQGLLNLHIINNLENQPVINSIKEIIADIYNAEELIKKTFCIEVRSVR